VQGVVQDVHPGVGPHLQRLADRVRGALGPHRQHGHRGVVSVLGQPQRRLDGVLVELGQQTVDTGPVGGPVVGEPAIGLRVRHVLHTHHDLHGGGSTSSSVAPDRNPSGSFGAVS